MHRRLLIDGYSLLYRDTSLDALRARDMRRAREALIRKIDRIADALADSVEIVFDGRTGSPEDIRTGRVRVLFSNTEQSADTVIEQLVHQDPGPAEIQVVTADRLERDTVLAADAQVISCAAFLERLDRLDRDLTRAAARSAPRARFTLGDQFPEI